jgi:hypothetical protein
MHSKTMVKPAHIRTQFSFQRPEFAKLFFIEGAELLETSSSSRLRFGNLAGQSSELLVQTKVSSHRRRVVRAEKRGKENSQVIVHW